MENDPTPARAIRIQMVHEANPWEFSAVE